MGTQDPLLTVLMRREGPAVSLFMTTSCKSTVLLMSEAFIESVKLGFTGQPYEKTTSFTATTEVSGKLDSDDSVVNNTFLKGGVMLKA